MEEKLKNLARGLLTGLLAAPFITLFSNLVNSATAFNSGNRWLIFFLPAGSLIITWIYSKVGKDAKNITGIAIRNIQFAEDGNTSLKGEARIKIKAAITGFLTSVFSHFLGASVGKEGIGVQIGLACASVLDNAEDRLLSESRRDYYLISGASAAFSALFGAPIAGSLFGAHIASPKLQRFDAFLPSIAAAFSSYFVSQAMHIHVLSVPPVRALPLTLENAVTVFFFAVLIGAVCSLSCRLLEFFKEKLNTLYPGGDYIKALIPALLLLAVSVLSYFIKGSFRYNGLSVDLMRLSMFRAVDFSDFIIKLLMVLLSLAAGFQGGEVVPLLVLGSTFTSSLATVFSLDASAYSILGAIGFLAAGTKLPLVTFALGMELFGYSEPALLFLMTATALIASGKVGIYSHQRIY